MPNQIISTRLANLDQEYRAFVESDFIEEAAEAFSEPLNISGRNLEVLQNSFYLYLLFFLNKESTIEFISTNCDLPKQDASELFAAFETSLPDGLNEMIRGEYIRQNHAGDQPGLDSEIAEAEQNLTEIQGLRTMAGDASVVAQAPVNTYQSSQAKILTRPEEPAVPTPTVLPPRPPTDNPPRWGSEQ